MTQTAMKTLGAHVGIAGGQEQVSVSNRSDEETEELRDACCIRIASLIGRKLTAEQLNALLKSAAEADIVLHVDKMLVKIAGWHQ